MQNLKCPKCGGEIIEKDKLYQCSEGKYDFDTKQAVGCDWKMWKTFLGKEITKEDLENLLNGETIHKTGLKSKKGNIFEADIKMNDNESGKLVLMFKNN